MVVGAGVEAKDADDVAVPSPIRQEGYVARTSSITDLKGEIQQYVALVGQLWG